MNFRGLRLGVSSDAGGDAYLISAASTGLSFAESRGRSHILVDDARKGPSGVAPMLACVRGLPRTKSIPPFEATGKTPSLGAHASVPAVRRSYRKLPFIGLR